ncbi:MAG TPA: TonB-dependent receptor, partial [Magnetospirillaceae bacterium]|nr:TonB-dependent receptor [Magnetospirillaceae bacterium]
IAPNLTITKTSQPGNNSINMRGVGTYSLSIASQTSVAVVIDDVPQAIQAEAFGALVGVQQIEVLRGPQSTLFGKSADSGLINITTAQPSNKFTASAEVMATSDQEEHFQGAVSGPVSDSVKVRLTVNDSTYRGNVFNSFSGNWLNGTSDKTVRGNILWEPTADWSVSLTPYVTKTTASCCAVALSYVTPGVTFPSTSKTVVPYQQAYPGIVPGSNNHDVAQTVDASGNADDFGSGLRISHQFASGHSLMSITSFDHYELDDRQSTDQSAYNFQLLNAKLPYGGSGNGGYFHVNNVTEEVRLTSPDSGWLKYVAGVYTSDQWASRYYVRGSDTLGTFNGQTPLATSSPYSRYTTSDTIATYAAYGQATAELTDRLTVVGGARYEHEANSYNFFDLVDNVAYGSPNCSTATPSGLAADTCNSTDSVTGKAAVQYKVMPDLMVFFDYARGFKGEAYDLTSSLTVRGPLTSGVYKGFPNSDVIAAAQPIAAETSDNFEFGYKGSFFNRRLTWNTTAFYEEFHNYQSSREDPITQLKELQSVPLVTTKGLETEIAARPLSGLTLTFNGAYDLAQSNNFTGAACYSNQTVAGGCVASLQDLSGARLSNAPKWSGSGNAEYDFNLNDDYTGFINANYRFQSLVYFNTSLDPNSVQTSYGLVDLSVGAQNDHYKLTLFVNNIANQHYALERGTQTLLNINPYGGKAGPITNATFWAPGRENDRYVGMKFAVTY